MPFLPLWLDWRGLSPWEISVIAAAPQFLRVPATPAMAYAIDTYGDRRRALVWLALLTMVVVAGLNVARGFWLILPITLCMALCWSTIMPVTETVAMANVRALALDYGRMRLWGSISFIAASACGGLVVGAAGPQCIVWLLLAAAGLTSLAALRLPRSNASSRREREPGHAASAWGDVTRLLTSRWFVVFLFAAGCAQASHAVFYALGAVHWRAIGLSAGWIGALWAVGVVAEIALFAFSGAAVRAIGPVGLLAIGATAGVLRWIVTAFDPPLALLVPLQVLHALTFGATHLGAVHVISAHVPSQAAGTAQALNASATSGIAMGSATLLAGQLYGAAGAQAYLAMAALSLLGLMAAGILVRVQPGARMPGSLPVTDPTGRSAEIE